MGRPTSAPRSTASSSSAYSRAVTRAEQTLDETDKGYVVAAGRLGLQEAMGDEMIEAVQSVLGRPVRSLMSANDVERDLQVEVFVLEPGSS